MTIATITPDNLLNKNIPISSEEITLISGQNLTRGTLLGKITLAAGTVSADAGNTGDGTVTELALADGGPAKIGTYNVECVEAITNSGRFKIVDPDGQEIASNVLIPAGAGNNIVFTGNGITLKITDGSTDFAVGDKFAITVIAGSGKFNKSLAAAVDGSEIPESILSEDKDASAGDKTTLAYIKGGFNTGAMTFGTGHTAASVKSGLRDKGIFLDAASPA